MSKVLNYFTDDAILFFKTNSEEFCKKMNENKDNPDWVNDFYGKKATAPSPYEFDFKFKKFEKEEGKEDYENAVALYELFNSKGIGPSTIYNEKFMTGFIFTYGYKYFMKIAGASHAFSMLFFQNDIHRSVIRNAVARLYRFVELTVDEDNKEDKYWLTKFAFNNTACFRFAFNTSLDGETSHKAYIKACKIWVEKGNKLTNPLCDDLKKHYSMLINVSDTDLMNEDDVIKYLLEYLETNK